VAHATELLVDLESIQEFMREAQQQISDVEMHAIEHEARAKSERFRALLGTPGAARGMDRDGLRRVLRSVFPVRRRADSILNSLGPVELAVRVDDLLHGPEPLAARWPRFCDGLEGAADLASELLHFTFPERWWLWTRWMWDPILDTGALRLVTTDATELRSADPVETYYRVGRAVAFVQETGAAAGIARFSSGGPFAVDVFLTCVYGVYLYTVVRIRMTREFNRFVPELPQLARRLLGIRGMEV
jgi:hypothetical protein